MRTPLVAALLIALAVPAFAQEEDAEGSKDHPMFTRFAGYYIEDYDEQEFGAYEFELGEETEPRRVEGHYWHITYRLNEGGKKAGPLQIVRNYVNALAAKGGKKLFEETDSNYGRAVASQSGGRGNVWLEVTANEAGETYQLFVVDGGSMEQEIEFSPADMAAELKAKGSVALHGILFDTGKATIKPESAAVLQAVAELLASDPGLKIEIQGHTDNVGAKAANQRLSEQRAAAVRNYLVEQHQVAPGRLTSAGYGDTRPVGGNDTEEGRAQNRRVELVRK